MNGRHIWCEYKGYLYLDPYFVRTWYAARFIQIFKNSTRKKTTIETRYIYHHILYDSQLELALWHCQFHLISPPPIVLEETTIIISRIHQNPLLKFCLILALLIYYFQQRYFWDNGWHPPIHYIHHAAIFCSKSEHVCSKIDGDMIFFPEHPFFCGLGDPLTS